MAKALAPVGEGNSGTVLVTSISACLQTIRRLPDSQTIDPDTSLTNLVPSPAVLVIASRIIACPPGLAPPISIVLSELSAMGPLC